MTPELNRLINEINEKKKDRRIDRIKYALEAYLIALEEQARQKTLWYRVRKFFRKYCGKDRCPVGFHKPDCGGSIPPPATN